MAVFRVEKDLNYTTMCNYHLRDQSLSLKAKGLLSMLLSLPDSWKYSVRGLAAISREGPDGIMAGLKELEQRGYLERHQTRQMNGRMGQIEYVIFEMPNKKPDPDSPCTENPDPVKPYTEEPDPIKSAEINKDKLNKDRLNKDLSNTDGREGKKQNSLRHFYGMYKNVLLSDEDFEKLKAEFPRDFERRIERLSKYMESSGKHYKSHLATIRSWARRDDRQEKKTGYSAEDYRYEEGESL